MSNRPDIPSLFFAGFTILYPIMALVAVHTIGAEAAIVLLCSVTVARFLFPANKRLPLLFTLVPLPVVAAVVAVAMLDAKLSVRIYPVLVNLTMLGAFAVTLWRPPSMIERFARVVEPDLPRCGVIYTRKVTIVWCIFFGSNASIALWTALQPSWRIWTIYNGGISYAAAGTLFAIEFFVRRRRRGAR